MIPESGGGSNTEADPVDVAAQETPVARDEAADFTGGPSPDEANEADVQEQERLVAVDDDYDQ